MPLFNWNAPTATGVVGNHFWVYWAVTGPLTLVTMVLVGIWITVRNSMYHYFKLWAIIEYLVVVRVPD